MKRATSLLLLTPLLVGFQEDEDEQEREYEIRLGLAKGEKIHYEAVVAADRTVRNQQGTGEQRTTVEIVVGDAHDDGSTEMTMDVVRLVFETPNSHYDSERSMRNTSDQSAAINMALLKGVMKPKIAPDGEVRERADDDVIAKLSEVFGNAPPPGQEPGGPRKAPPASARKLEVLVNEAFGLGAFTFLPRGPVRRRDTWKIVERLQMVDLHWEARLAAVKKEKATIQLKLADVKFPEGQAGYEVYDIAKEKKGGGKVVFDLEKGRTVSLRTEYAYCVTDKAGAPVLKEKMSVRIELLRTPPKIKNKW